MIVIDASIALSWFFADEHDDLATRSAARVLEESALVPAIFPSEVGNALLYAHRKRRISERSMHDAIERIAHLTIRVDSAVLDLRDEIELAKRHDLTVYDAMYLALARRRRIPVLTRDTEMHKAAVAEKLMDR